MVQVLLLFSDRNKNFAAVRKAEGGLLPNVIITIKLIGPLLFSHILRVHGQQLYHRGP